jgi:hypothetical protein
LESQLLRKIGQARAGAAEAPPAQWLDLPVRFVDVFAQKLNHFGPRFRGAFKQTLAGFPDFKARLKAHGADGVLKEILIPREPVEGFT